MSDRIKLKNSNNKNSERNDVQFKNFVVREKNNTSWTVFGDRTFLKGAAIRATGRNRPPRMRLIAPQSLARDRTVCTRYIRPFSFLFDQLWSFVRSPV